MIGPSVRSKLRLRAATSSAREVSGSGAADTFTASAFSAVMTRAQLDPSAHAPWASTTLTSFIAILLLPRSRGLPAHNKFRAKLVPADALDTLKARAMPGELDKVADRARDVREWFSGFVRKHMGRPDSSPDTRTGIIRQLSHPKSLEADVDCDAGECPVRVIRVGLGGPRRLPVYPERTFSGKTGMSQ